MRELRAQLQTEIEQQVRQREALEGQLATTTEAAQAAAAAATTQLEAAKAEAAAAQEARAEAEQLAEQVAALMRAETENLVSVHVIAF